MAGGSGLHPQSDSDPAQARAASAWKTLLNRTRNCGAPLTGKELEQVSAYFVG